MVAVIEAPFTLLQKPVEVARRDAIDPPQRPFCLVPNVLNAIDVMPSLGHEDLAVVHAPVVKCRDIQHIIRGETIRIDDAVWGHLLTNDGQACVRSGIWNNCGQHLPASF